VAPSDIEPRTRALEIATATHEARCEERYRAINWKLNFANALLTALLAVAAMGNPLIDLIQRIVGGGR